MMRAEFYVPCLGTETEGRMTECLHLSLTGTRFLQQEMRQVAEDGPSASGPCDQDRCQSSAETPNLSPLLLESLARREHCPVLASCQLTSLVTMDRNLPGQCVQAQLSFLLRLVPGATLNDTAVITTTHHPRHLHLGPGSQIGLETFKTQVGV